MKVLTVGSMAFDSVATPRDSRTRVLGGSVSYFSMAASLFCDVSIISCVGEDFPESYWAPFKSRGININHIEKRPGKTFYWEGRYSEDFESRDTLRTDVNVFETFTPHIPDSLTSVPVVFLANISPDLQHHVLTQLTNPQWVVLDTMNFWLKSQRPSLLALLPKVDILLLNEEEAIDLGASQLLDTAATQILSLGPKLVVVKQSRNGATLFHKDYSIQVPAYSPVRVIDPTGAGDSFAGGFIGIITHTPHLTKEVLTDALCHGTIAASFAIEDFSIDGLTGVTREIFANRLAYFKDMLNK